MNLVLDHSQPDKLLCTITQQWYQQVSMILKIIFYIFILKKLFVFVAGSYCLLLSLLVLTSSTSGNPLSRGDGSESKKVSIPLLCIIFPAPSPLLFFHLGTFWIWIWSLLNNNNNNNNINNSTCNHKITLTIKFIYAGFCCIFKKRPLKDVFSDKSKKNCVTI